ncbi:MAG: hypothetical protein Q9164_006975, partial [Protoblastenia rupestris]
MAQLETFTASDRMPSAMTPVARAWPCSGVYRRRVAERHGGSCLPVRTARVCRLSGYTFAYTPAFDPSLTGQVATRLLASCKRSRYSEPRLPTTTHAATGETACLDYAPVIRRPSSAEDHEPGIHSDTEKNPDGNIGLDFQRINEIFGSASLAPTGCYPGAINGDAAKGVLAKNVRFVLNGCEDTQHKDGWTALSKGPAVVDGIPGRGLRSCNLHDRTSGDHDLNTTAAGAGTHGQYSYSASTDVAGVGPWHSSPQRCSQDID